eukprot:TRINITY_DN11_c0_g3_i1.p1 TRINITY_DN11_c0_g3~~TRINITY_DN11_c0_g3_i1.p1  ORF type:complete len:581 (-),score=180.01 TRINITY_DN11_c0_g3_i1:1074-2816(-)
MSAENCESKLSIHLSCANLRNMDFIGRSDPFALLFLDPTGSVAPASAAAPPPPSPAAAAASVSASASASASGAYRARDARWQRVGMTETIYNSLNVTWATSFEIPYFFERAQKLAVDVFDRDDASEKDAHLHRHDYLGSAQVSVPALVRARGQRKTLPLRIDARPNQRCGTLTIIAENVSLSNTRISLHMRLSAFAPRRALGALLRTNKRPYVSVSRAAADGDDVNARDADTIIVWRSEAGVRSGADAHAFEFEPLSLKYEKLCRRDEELPLLFEVWWQRGGQQRVVARTRASLKQCALNGGALKLRAVQQQQSCVAPSPRAPVLHVSKRSMTDEPTFLDYIIGGCDMSMVVAIDFTASNGDPSQRGTLHFFDSMQPNEYELAIRAVGDILGAYSADQRFPAYGFGAKLPPDFQQPCHLFSLTGGADATCHTVDDVLNMYRQTLYSVRLSGPTHFSEVIRAAAKHADVQLTQSRQCYCTLLIVSDGVISDMQSTLREIALASMLPMSIVIIGVGDADFSDMRELDGDEREQERDIVQFVQFRQYRHAPEVLRAMVLEEIPTQLVQYMTQRNIVPNAAPRY